MVSRAHFDPHKTTLSEPTSPRARNWVDYSLHLSGRHDALKAQVKSLSNESLDLDMLEVEARRDLFVSGVNEVTIWLDP